MGKKKSNVPLKVAGQNRFIHKSVFSHGVGNVRIVEKTNLGALWAPCWGKHLGLHSHLVLGVSLWMISIQKGRDFIPLTPQGFLFTGE